MDTALETLSQDLSDIVNRTSRFVVSIKGKRSAGTGIHWKEGFVVTSCEALHPEDDLQLGLPNGESVGTTLLGSDPATDVAVLSLPEGTDIPVAVLGDAQALSMGQLVSTVGYSAGQRGRMQRQFSSLGMVSEVGEGWRSQQGGQIDRYISVNLELRRGSAGCPLVNAGGQVVGFNTFGPRRRVLTIPASTVSAVVDQLQQRGKLSRGYLGLGMQMIALPENVRSQHDIEQQAGVLVVSVDSGSAADEAGLVLGDVMTAFGGEALESLRQVQSFLGPQSVGKKIAIQLLRGGELRSADVVVGER